MTSSDFQTEACIEILVLESFLLFALETHQPEARRAIRKIQTSLRIQNWSIDSLRL